LVLGREKAMVGEKAIQSVRERAQKWGAGSGWGLELRLGMVLGYKWVVESGAE
jgi:hypothetical protein